MRACNNFPQPPKTKMQGLGCSHSVSFCIYSFWHGVIPTSYFIFNDFYTNFLSRLSLDCIYGTPVRRYTYKVQSSLHCPFGMAYIQVNVHVSNVTKDNISVPNPADENNPRVNRAHALSHNENNPTTPEAYWWDRALALSLCGG